MNDKLTIQDVTGEDILLLSKEKLTQLARDLEVSYDSLKDYEILFKLRYLAETRLEVLKKPAMEMFLEKFGGSTTERENGFSITYSERNTYEYSEDVKKLEEKMEKLKMRISAMKEEEKSNGTAKKIKSQNILAFTLK